MAKLFTAPEHPYTRGLVATARIDQVPPGQRLPTVEDFIPGGAMTGNTPLYQVRELTRTFGRDGRVRALDGVSLALPPASGWASWGSPVRASRPWIRLMAALDRPTSGS